MRYNKTDLLITRVHMHKVSLVLFPKPPSKIYATNELHIGLNVNLFNTVAKRIFERSRRLLTYSVNSELSHRSLS